MLSEIFKGMDNAAELINENFENGSIVESGKNEFGHYFRMGNGVQVCLGRFNHNFDNDQTVFPTFPKGFKDTSYFVKVAAGDTSWQAVELSAFMGAGPQSVASPRITAYPRTSGSFYGERTFVYLAFVHWK